MRLSAILVSLLSVATVVTSATESVAAVPLRDVTRIAFFYGSGVAIVLAAALVSVAMFILSGRAAFLLSVCWAALGILVTVRAGPFVGLQGQWRFAADADFFTGALICAHMAATFVLAALALGRLSRRDAGAIFHAPLLVAVAAMLVWHRAAAAGWVAMTPAALYGWQLAGAGGFVVSQLLLYRQAWRQAAVHRTRRRRLVYTLREKNRGLEDRVAGRTLELADALADARQAVDRQREMLSLASHEFRTPAAMIKASLDSLRLIGPQVPAPVAERLDNIARASARLNGLANNLLSLQRLQELSLKPEKQLLDLEQDLRRIVESYPGDTGPVLRVETDLPQVMADPVLVDIALYNLIDNANRHNDAGAGPVVVRVLREGNLVSVMVSDHGRGIEDARKEQVFEKYVSTQGYGTNGLGLAIVRAIMQAHGGTARAEDHAPGGASLVITFHAAVET